MSGTAAASAPVLQVEGGSLRFGQRVLWDELDLSVARGEFLAVLGANGSGKTSLLKAILGQLALSEGQIRVSGRPVRRGDRSIGYIPQQRLIPAGTPLRARDLIGLGIDGHRFGLPLPSRGKRERVDALLGEVGATSYADEPVGSLSGGEQQRLRVGQSLASDPVMLLCDEPLISLDLNHQRAVSELIDRRRRDDGTAVVFVTHDINPILPMVDRVLYLADGRFLTGTPDEVLRSEVLTALYKTPIEVIRAAGQVIVVGVPDQHGHHGPAGHEHGTEATA
ncbi:metal ABC transporter ATP-binding protein [Mycetocola reblochoni]|uniref:Zinc ABC transporter, ATP-binding protein ZnuC n=2 Tax=Mycetocola reblochoni TaxID=331618 RepID=A0A1R4JM88_9MICO|nr:ATP-binding cassette domain-containing protein [Mycetocola reblochoni]RLP68568.1 ATP-binding cassette domain-containing protein [Mycetocola reblochoni]SJN33044.1 Zinc ABC transporter, ATP-binding protein ZnuC [Mycetocola reblochoni REB411]